MDQYQIKQVIPYYQPIVELKSGKILMYESLARLIDYNGHGINSSNMNELFSDPGFSWKVLQKMLPEVVRHAGDGIEIAINVEASSFGDKFNKLLETLFNSCPQVAGFLHFEITERSIGRDIAALSEHVDLIKSMGAKVVLDDFGTGASNFECLEQIKFDHVKIDGQFLKAAAVDKFCHKRLVLFVDLLKSYGVPIVGEHIENIDIETIAKKMGIDYGQGYFYGKPEPMIKGEKIILYA